MEIESIFRLGISILFTLIAVVTGFVIITENRNPLKSIAWVTVLVLFPVVGLVAYFFFGKNFRKQKIISKKSIKRIQKHSNRDFKENVSFDFIPEEYKGLTTLLYQNNESLPYADNAVSVYTNGPDAFDSVFTEIEKATHHIHVQFFIFNNDKIGNSFKDLLAKKTAEGVQVRLIYDSLGSWRLGRKFVKKLNDLGIETGSFLKVNLPFFSNKVNYRNHRKVVVIDGKVGFIGGMNVADRYITGSTLGTWRDTLIKIEGNAVHGLQNAFLIDWYFIHRTYITSAEYYPLLQSTGNKLVQTVTSGPDSDWEAILQSFCKLISTAKSYVYMQTPYFLPPEDLLSAIKIAALSGVDVRLMISENSDAPVTSIASRSYLREIMNAGVKVYFYNNGFIHSKTIVADDLISTIGSTNMDFRSFELHFEINSFVYDNDFAVEMREIYLKDLENSKEIQLSTWRKREKWKKFNESFARLFSPLL